MDLSDGYPPVSHPEYAGRVERVLAGFARAWSLDLQEVAEGATEAVAGLHDADYLEYMTALSGSLNSGQEIIPSLFRGDMREAPLALRAGMYCSEIGTPVMSTTWRAAQRSAAAALRAASALAGGERRALALCRPPGHHAGRRRFGGYCYINNAYVAARRLAAEGATCAVLDVDYHLGDGSMEFASGATPYFSLHADPWSGYPYLDHADGREVADATLVVLAEHTDGESYLKHLARVLDGVRAAGADALVVSLGFDTVASDRIQDIHIGLCPADYRPMGAAIAELGLPTAIVLEGGYDPETLTECAAGFAAGLGASAEPRNG